MAQSSLIQAKDQSGAAPLPPAAPISSGRVAPGHGIFISYASRDGDVANRVVNALEERGLTCWISARDIPPGADYQASIVTAIDVAPVMLLLLSRNAMASKEIPKETSIASELSRTIVPVVIDNAEITGALRYQVTNAQRLNLSADFEAGVDRLALSLAQLLGVEAQARQRLRRLALRRRLAFGLVWPLAVALILLGAASVWHFQAQLRALRDSLASAGPPGPQAEPTGRPARTGRVQPPTLAHEEAPDRRVRAFVEQYYATLSGPGEQVPGFLEQGLTDPVQFYGRPLPRRVILAEETAYTQRWPDRSFVIRPDTLVVSCQTDISCSAEGVIDYTVRSAARHLVSSGAEHFDLRVTISPVPRLASITTSPAARRSQTQP